MLDYLEQGVNSLRLYLHHNTDPALQQFNCIKDTRFAEHGVVVHFGILAESHFVSLSLCNEELTEICACSDGAFPQPPVIASTLANLPADYTQSIGTFTYTFSHGKMAINAISVDFIDYEHVLKHQFPKQHTDEHDAYTEVGVTITPGMIKIQSIHTYPNEHAAVLTKSTITW